MWTRRGDAEPSAKRIEQLILDPETVVIRWWSGPETVPIDERRALLADIVRVRKGQRRGQEDYRCGEFKAPDGRHLLIVEEFC